MAVFTVLDRYDNQFNKITHGWLLGIEVFTYVCYKNYPTEIITSKNRIIGEFLLSYVINKPFITTGDEITQKHNMATLWIIW